MAWSHHTDPFNLVDRPHKVKAARKISRGRKRGMVHHLKYLSFYGTKYNPAAKDKIPTPRG